jgi:hypothetical protein
MAVCLSVIGLNPVEDVNRDRVDLIEVNHLYDDKGGLVFDQVIFYNWCGKKCRYEVCDYRLLKKSAQLPKRNWRLKKYEAVWHDGDLLRRVTAPSFRETWTRYDPELAERDNLPKEKRAGLSKLLIRGK